MDSYSFTNNCPTTYFHLKIKSTYLNENVIHIYNKQRLAYVGIVYSPINDNLTTD